MGDFRFQKEASMAENPIGVRPDENPRQGFSSKTPSDVAERERTVETTRDADTRRGHLARRNPVYGTSSPFSLMRRMADDIERLFSNLDYSRSDYGLQEPQLYSSGAPWRSSRMLGATWAPQLETFRRDGKLVLRADLPGLSKDDVEIDVDDDMLTISGERRDEYKDQRDDYYRTERTYGRFFRAIQLPEGVNHDEIDATFKDGVLEVTIPEPKVNEMRRQRQVKIK
jgi:HSP20 family protein